MSVTGFRPFTGPASLKRCVRVDLPPSAVGFRPFTGPASLKHRAPGPSPWPSSSFRPFTGPASLKPAPPPQFVSAFRAAGFRPFTGPASLKQLEAARRQVVFGGFPALHRAGLIEAGKGASAAADGPVFPALHRAGLIEAGCCGSGRPRTRPCGFPALHRAGLIEARRAPDRRSSPRRVSGPSQGRPH